MEEFKKFASSRPFLKKKVDNKEVTWQELFEKYDIVLCSVYVEEKFEVIYEIR